MPMRKTKRRRTARIRISASNTRLFQISTPQVCRRSRPAVSSPKKRGRCSPTTPPATVCKLLTDREHLEIRRFDDILSVFLAHVSGNRDPMVVCVAGKHSGIAGDDVLLALFVFQNVMVGVGSFIEASG